MHLNRDFRNVCVDLINRPNGSEEILLPKGTENILEIEYDLRKEEGICVKCRTRQLNYPGLRFICESYGAKREL